MALAFAVLLLPAILNLSFVAVARLSYPRPQDLESSPPNVAGQGLPRLYWVYLIGASLVAAGFADFPLIAFHFEKADVLPGEWIAVFYAVAMGVSGTASLIFGRLFDRFGFKILIGLTMVTALFAPLVFLGEFWTSLLGAAIWGIGMGVHESIIPAAVAPRCPFSAELLLSDYSPRAMASAGSPAALLSASSMIFLSPVPSPSASWQSWPQCRYSSGSDDVMTWLLLPPLSSGMNRRRTESQTLSFEFPCFGEKTHI